MPLNRQKENNKHKKKYWAISTFPLYFKCIIIWMRTKSKGFIFFSLSIEEMRDFMLRWHWCQKNNCFFIYFFPQKRKSNTPVKSCFHFKQPLSARILCYGIKLLCSGSVIRKLSSFLCNNTLWNVFCSSCFACCCICYKCWPSRMMLFNTCLF